MLILLSPAKSLDETAVTSKSTLPRTTEAVSPLIKKLRTYSVPKLKALMSISPALALQNKQRYANFDLEDFQKNAKPAMYLFTGDVYRGLDAGTMSEKQQEFAQKHLRILSGLYGLLRPLDAIQPYRLEMGTKLPIRRKKNLYEYWGDTITQLINEDLETMDHKLVVNLASDEYWHSVHPDKLSAKVIKVNFKEERDGQWRFLSFNAKRARGLMARFLIDNEITTLDHLKAFDTENYTFNPELSSENSLIFTR